MGEARSVEKLTEMSSDQLGWLYYQGKGISRDYIRAYMWWNISGTEGVEVARKYRDKISKIISPTQLEKAQDLTRECMRKNYKRC